MTSLSSTIAIFSLTLPMKSMTVLRLPCCFMMLLMTCTMLILQNFRICSLFSCIQLNLHMLFCFSFWVS